MDRTTKLATQNLIQTGRSHLFFDIRFDHVAQFEIVEAIQRDTTFIPLLHFAHVIFKAAQTANRSIKDDDVIADQPRLRSAFDEAIQHIRTRNRTNPRYANDVAHFSLAEHSFLDGRIQHTDHGIANFFFDFIYDRMQANIHIFLLGRFIGTGHLLARLAGRDLSRFTRCQTREEQRAYFDREIAPLFDSRPVRWITNRRATLFGLGIPPAQYDALCDGKPMSQVLKQRLERLACDFPLSENYFAWQAFARSYAPDATGPLPPYLQRSNFQALQKRADRVQMLHASLTDVLDKMKPGSAHRFVLLDAQDWMTDGQLNALWSAITRAAAPGARVIFRTAGEKTILPGRVAEGTLSHWTYLETLSAELGAEDRSSIYGGFHVYELGG